MILVLTTFCHLLSTLPALTSAHSFRYAYSTHVVASTILSAIWHLKEQPEGAFMYMDYSFIAIWFFYDMGLMSHLPNLEQVKIVAASIFVLCLHEVCSYPHNYAVYHSLWHIASAIKCLYVSCKVFGY